MADSRTSHSYTQRWWRAHSPTNLPFSQTEVVEGTLTHSLTDYPLEGVGGQSEDHTHPNSLSHTDSRARSLSHSLTHSHSQTLSLHLSLFLTNLLSLSYSPTLSTLLDKKS